MITKIRKTFSKWYYVLPLCCSIFFLSCQTQDEAALPVPQEYAAVDFFKGIMFSQGEVAARIPLLQRNINARTSLSLEMQNKMADIESAIIKTIDQQDPTYLEQFKTSIKSGNHLAIQQEIAVAQGKILASVAKLTGREVPKDFNSVHALVSALSTSANFKTIVNEDGSINQESVQQFESLESNREALLLVLVVAVAVALWFWVVEANSETQSSLYQEELVHSLSQFSTTL